MFPKSSGSLATLMLALALTGCDQQPAASSLAAPVAAANAGSTNEDAGTGKGYAFHIRYPQLQPEWNTLAPALRAFADAQKKAFLAERSADSLVNRPYNLGLEFTVARRTSDFVSVLASGNVDTGGAHPNPILDSFTLHPADSKLLAIGDLFADPAAALKALSDESRRQLEGRYEAAQHDGDDKQRAADHKEMFAWIERGTQPTADGFKVFLVDGLDSKAIGLTLIFPPYQVAAYADGPQQLEVPANVFYAFLKPEYRDAFAIDTEAGKIAPGVH